MSIESRKKSSIILTILLSFFFISIIWVCFIMGRILHGSSQNDEDIPVYNDEDNNVIDNGGMIVFEPKDEKDEKNNTNELHENIIINTSANKIPSYSYTNTQNNNIEKNQSSNNNKVKNEFNEPNNIIEEPQKPIEPSKPEPEEPTKPDKPEEPIKPEEPEEPIKPEDPTEPEDPEDPTEPEKPEDPEEPINRDGTYWVQDKEIVWENNSILGIFKNPKYNMRNIIAPGSTSSYVFYVCNKMGFDLNYIINFSEENDMNVNMMYKLKREDEYIIGDENTWVYYDQLHIDYNIANEGKDKYVLEWKWVDSDNDTEIGIKHAGELYKLKIDICATQISGLEEENPETDEEENPGTGEEETPGTGEEETPGTDEEEIP